MPEEPRRLNPAEIDAETRRIGHLLQTRLAAQREEGLRALLQTENGLVFMKVVRGLGAFGDAEALETLLAGYGTRGVMMDAEIEKAARSILLRDGTEGGRVLLRSHSGNAGRLAALLASCPRGDAAPVASAAVLQLGRDGTEEAARQLSALVASDASRDVRTAAARLLTPSPFVDLAIAGLVAALGDEALDSVLTETITELHARAPGRTQSALTDVLRDGAPEAKRQAIRLLARLGDASVLPLLAGAAADPALGPDVRQALSAAGRRLGGTVTGALVRLASDAAVPDDGRVGAVLGLADAWGNPAHWPPYAAGDESEIAVALLETGPPPVREAMAEVLKRCFGQFGKLRQRALAERLATRPSPEITRLLEALASDARSPGQRVALEVLGRPYPPGSDDPAVVAPLLVILESGTPDQQVEACRRCAERGHHRAAPVLLTLLRHAQPRVREAAAAALMKLGVREAVPALIVVLADDALWPTAEWLRLYGHRNREWADARGQFLHALATLGEDDAALGALLRHRGYRALLGHHATFPGDDAIVRLARRMGARAFDGLESTLSKQAQEGEVEERILKAAVATGDPRLRTWLLRHLAEGRPFRGALSLLAEIGHGDDVAAILPLLSPPAATVEHWPSRTEAVGALATLLARDPVGVPGPTLERIALLDDESVHARARDELARRELAEGSLHP